MKSHTSSCLMMIFRMFFVLFFCFYIWPNQYVNKLSVNTKTVVLLWVTSLREAMASCSILIICMCLRPFFHPSTLYHSNEVTFMHMYCNTVLMYRPYDPCLGLVCLHLNCSVHIGWVFVSKTFEMLKISTKYW